MALERQYLHKKAYGPTIEDLWTELKTDAPMTVLSQEQAQLIYRWNGRFDNFGTPIAKPWETSYRGEIFVYVPERKIKVPIDLQPYEYDEKPIGRGIVGIANLRSIALVENQKEWEETFSEHKEIGEKPFKKTFLWYLHPVTRFRNPINIKVGGKWLSENEWPKHEVPSDLENYILPPKNRELHKLSLFHILYMNGS